MLHSSPIPEVCCGLQEATLTSRDANGCNDMRDSLRFGDLDSESNPWGLLSQLLHIHCLCESGQAGKEAGFELRVGLYIHVASCPTECLQHHIPGVNF
jgi:hypothetical protein